MENYNHLHDSEDELPKQEEEFCPVKKSSSWDRNKLMRTPEAEPREFVYVYNYRENRTRRMKKQELLEKLGTSIDCPSSYDPSVLLIRVHEFYSQLNRRSRL